LPIAVSARREDDSGLLALLFLLAAAEVTAVDVKVSGSSPPPMPS
jgi:hypothetical protein